MLMSDEIFSARWPDRRIGLCSERLYRALSVNNLTQRGVP